MHAISKSDIEGCRIIRIHSTSRIEEGYTVSQCFFTTNRGHTFTLPEPGDPFSAKSIPAGATELIDVIEEPTFLVKKHWLFGTRFVRQTPTRIDTVKRIKERVVSGIFCPPLDEDLGVYPPDSSFILFDDRSRATCVTAAPTATGSAGLYHHNQGFDDDVGIVNFFAIPTVDPNSQEGLA